MLLRRVDDLYRARRIIHVDEDQYERQVGFSWDRRLLVLVLDPMGDTSLNHQMRIVLHILRSASTVKLLNCTCKQEVNEVDRNSDATAVPFNRANRTVFRCGSARHNA